MNRPSNSKTLRANSWVKTAARRMGLIGALLMVAAPISNTASATTAAKGPSVPKLRKLAMVDLQRVMNETKQGKKARADLEKNAKGKEKKLEKKQAKLEADQAKLQSLKGQAQQAAVEKLQRDYQELQNMAMTLQQELATQQSEIYEKLYKNCQSLVSKMAGELELDVVLIRDQTTIIYAQNSLDITKKVIAKYDKKYPK